MTLPFNRVRVRSVDGITSLLNVSEFSALPLTERVRAMLEKRVQFFQDDAPVEQSAALKALREHGG